MLADDAYREDLAYVHDSGYGDVARDAARMLLDELERDGRRGGTVVDLGCGTGVLASHLGEAGYRVVGFDVSESMLALARTRAPKAKFHVGSFVSAALPECVAVTAIGEVLNYRFDPANDNRARAGFFRRVHEALLPGGLFLFDVAGPGRAKPGRHRTFSEGADWAVLVETELDAPARALTRTITTFRRVGTLYRRDVELHRLALIDPEELLESLRGVGFEAGTIPGYGTSPLPPGVVTLLCRKPGVAAAAGLSE